MAKKKRTFEEALAQLEEIAKQIEQGSIGLEDSIARYEEGMELVRYCRDILAQAELKIQKLQARENGTAGLTDMKPLDAAQNEDEE